MNKKYNIVPLCEVLTHYQDYIDEPEPIIYPKLSVKLYGKGAVLDTSVEGSSLKMKKHQIARKGQVILSEIWGKKGAIGIVPPEGNGALCTSHFFLFDVRDDKIDQKYLQAIFTSNYLEEQLNSEAQGTTGYAAVRPKHLLAATIPLPPLEEQHRIVARIEELATKIEEARGLRLLAQNETTQLFKNTLHNIFTNNEKKWSEVMIDSVAEIVDPNPSHRMPQYAETGIPFISTVDFDGPETIRKNTIKHVVEQTYQEQKQRCSFAINDILYSRIGTIGEARILSEVWPFALSHVLVVVKPKQEVILPRFLLWYLRSDSIVTQAHIATRSIGVPDLGIKKIREFSIPLPSLEEQKKIVTFLDNQQLYITQLKYHQSQTTTELNALLPSILDKAFKGEL